MCVGSTFPEKTYPNSAARTMVRNNNEDIAHNLDEAA